jgi:hypothetical protein
MPLGLIDDTLLSAELPAAHREPAVVTWNRLEPRPRTTDFSRSLRAEVRDALWMLTRQWQLGEFEGEDAGSAVLARLSIEATRITRYLARGGPVVAFSGAPPLETQVERERISLDALTRVEMGRRWLRLLVRAGVSQAGQALFRRAFAFPAVLSPTLADAEQYANGPAWQFLAAAAGRAMDGGALHERIHQHGIAAADLVFEGERLSAEDRSRVEAAQAEFLAWFDRLLSQPRATEPSAWVPERLEYDFACAAPEAGGGQTVLVAEEYSHGRLDWYAFDVDVRPEAALGEPAGGLADDDAVRRETLTFIPTAVAFGGMPNARWWEFEDRRTDIGGIDAETTELARLLLAEFTLVYANDWMVVPYRLPVGTICRVLGLAVVDTFGERTLVRPASHAGRPGQPRWTLFSLDVRGGGGAPDTRLFLPPVIGKSQEGRPVETVRLVRDEMANMTWAVEARIPDQLGAGREGFEAAQELDALLRELAPPSAPPPTSSAALRYVAGTTVPLNWIPFIPVHVPGSTREIQLRRAAMPRLIPGLPQTPVRPRGSVLRPYGDAPYSIFEEEVPRAGAVVTRAFQRVRGPDGATFVWLGRRKAVGREARSSGLRFDQIEYLRSAGQ